MRMFMMVCAVMFFTGCGGGGSTAEAQSAGKHTPPSPAMAAGEIRPPESPRLDGE